MAKTTINNNNIMHVKLDKDANVKVNNISGEPVNVKLVQAVNEINNPLLVKLENNSKVNINNVVKVKLDNIAPGENHVMVKLVDSDITLKTKCNDKIQDVDEKLKVNFDKLGLFITINTFSGSLLLFGVQRKKRDVNEEPYMTEVKRIIQVQLLNFCIFLGAIISEFIFITLTKFRSFDSRTGCFWIDYTGGNREKGYCVRNFMTLTPGQQTKYKEGSSPTFIQGDPDHDAVYKEAKEDDSCRDSLQKTSMFITFF